MGTALNLSFTEFASTTWEFLFAGNNRTPDTRLPVKQVDLSHFKKRGSDQLNATWLGHSSLMINIDGYKILADPVFEKRISIFGPTRFNGDVPLDIHQIPTVDAVIISHDHYDHLNKFSVRHLMDKTDTFIVPLHVGALLADWGVPRDKIVELDWWQEYRLNQELMIAATPALHFSGRGITDRNETLWASWVIEAPSHKVFFSGDSGYFSGFKQIGDKYGPFDMTFIECGAYGKSWPKVHMFPEQTVQAHLDLKGDVLHPIHWATFNLALHPWYEPMERLTAAADYKNIKVATPIVGETTVYQEHIPATAWWEQVMEVSRGGINTAVIEEKIKHE
ncbi:MAG: MBL fold metallo-hydrolase [Deltaproteobacteria bacterium]|nr:MBL fold metallo-hydrolase [Deltaproteobacteria bacterium]